MKQMKTQRVRLSALTDFFLQPWLNNKRSIFLNKYHPKGIWRRLPTNVTSLSIQFRMQTHLKKHMETQSSGSFALVSSPKGSAHLPSEEEQQRMSTEWAPLCATDSNSINSFTTLNLSINRSKKLTFYNKLALRTSEQTKCKSFLFQSTKLKWSSSSQWSSISVLTGGEIWSWHRCLQISTQRQTTQVM